MLHYFVLHFAGTVNCVLILYENAHCVLDIVIVIVFVYYVIKYKFNCNLLLRQDLMVGDEASKLRSLLEISYPMQNGIVRYK